MSQEYAIKNCEQLYSLRGNTKYAYKILQTCLFNTSIKQQFIECRMQDVSDGGGGKPLPVQGHHKGRQAAGPP
jgi:hypothetical protein